MRLLPLVNEDSRSFERAEILALPIVYYAFLAEATKYFCFRATRISVVPNRCIEPSLTESRHFVAPPQISWQDLAHMVFTPSKSGSNIGARHSVRMQDQGDTVLPYPARGEYLFTVPSS